MPRLLIAVDPGSIHCGVAIFERSEVGVVRAFSADPRADWLERMRDIGRDLTAWCDARLLEMHAGEPPILAIESVSLGMNVSTLTIMAQTRGWILGELVRRYGVHALVDVHLMSVRKMIGAIPKGQSLPPSAKRAEAIAKMREHAARRWAGDLSDDEAAAICIGDAAILALQAEASAGGPDGGTRRRSRGRARLGSRADP